MDIPVSNKKNSSFTLESHHIFLLRETRTINESNPGRCVHGIRIKKVCEYSVTFYLFNEKNETLLLENIAIKSVTMADRFLSFAYVMRN